MKELYVGDSIDLIGESIDSEYNIKEWNYKKGIIESEIGTINITKEGNLKYGEYTFKKVKQYIKSSDYKW